MRPRSAAERFVGATLWFSPDATAAPRRGDRRDFTEIRGVEPGVDEVHASTAWWLRAPVRAGDVVVPHPLPTRRAITPEYRGHPRNPFFVHGLDALILAARPALWCFGHKHSPFAALVGETLLVAKPSGTSAPRRTSASPRGCSSRRDGRGRGRASRRRPRYPPRVADESPKPVSGSHTELHQLMLPEHANPFGHVHGGVVLRLVDETAAISAMRHARRPCVTVAVDSVTFVSPVHVGQLLCCHAEVTAVGITSLEVEVHVTAEDLTTGAVTHTNAAHLVYVALGEDGRPTPVPPVRCETVAEQERARAAAERREARLARRPRRA